MASSLVFEQDETEEELLARALYVDEDDLAVDEDAEKPPTSGEEYLKKVIREAKKLQSVVIASNAEELLAVPPKEPTHVDRNKANVQVDGLLPSKEWQLAQVADFTSVRLKLARHLALLRANGETVVTPFKQPSLKNEYGWCSFCLGDEFWRNLIEARKANESDDEEKKAHDQKPDKKSFASETGEGHPPLISLISQLKQSTITRLIEFHSEWAEDTEAVNSSQALWFYALLSVVEKPLHPDVESSLRSFLIVCSKQRGRIVDVNSAKNTVSHLNLIICLVAKYFGQVDLADEEQ